MFSFRKEKIKIDFTREEQESFLSLLNRIQGILSNSNLDAQVDVVKSLIELVNSRDNEHFIKLINGVEMWGGSGAVWEVYIEDKSNAREFEMKMIYLIDLMEDVGILGKGIKPIRQIFLKNVK